MDRPSKPFRASIVPVLILCLVAAWLGLRTYHQMTTPVDDVVVVNIRH